MGEYLNVSFSRLHRGAATVAHVGRDYARQVSSCGQGFDGQAEERGADELHRSQGLPQERIEARASTLFLGELDGISRTCARGDSVLLDLLRAAQRHEGIGGAVMEGHSDLHEGQLQVDCHGHRHCVRASYRELHRNLRNPEQASRDRARAAQWAAAFLLGFGLLATICTFAVTHFIWLRLNDIVSR